MTGMPSAHSGHSCAGHARLGIVPAAQEGQAQAGRNHRARLAQRDDRGYAPSARALAAQFL